MISLELELLPRAAVPTERRGGLVVIVDVLRMTTTAAVLVAAGLDKLIVIAEIEAATACARESGALLFGERDGVPPMGFDGGNSPAALVGRSFAGRRAVLCTSNGSAAVEAYADADRMLLGSSVNAAAVARTALRHARSNDGMPTTITLVCAGTGGMVSLDDALAAGCIADELLQLEPAIEPSDACRLALTALPGMGLEAGLRASAHGRRLLALGFDADLALAAQRNRLASVPQRLAAAHPAAACRTGSVFRAAAHD